MIKFYCNCHQYCNQFRLFVQSWNITVDIDSFQIHNMIYILLIQITKMYMPFLLESNKIGFFFYQNTTVQQNTKPKVVIVSTIFQMLPILALPKWTFPISYSPLPQTHIVCSTLALPRCTCISCSGAISIGCASYCN